MAGKSDSFSNREDNDTWIIKVNSRGVQEWEQRFGDERWDVTSSVSQHMDGSYVLSGYSYTSGGPRTGWIRKLNPNGDLLWKKSLSIGDENSIEDMIISSLGEYLFVGDYYEADGTVSESLVGKVSQEGELRWTRSYEEGWSTDAILESSEGNYLVTGHKLLPSYGSHGTQLVAIDSAGDIQWQRSYGVNRTNDLVSSITSVSEGFLLTGNTKVAGNPSRGVVLLVDEQGRQQWRVTHGGNDRDAFYGAIESTDGDYVVIGKTESFNSNRLDAWLVKISTNGDVIGQQLLGDNGFQKLNSVVKGPGRNFVVAGSTSVDFRGSEGWFLELAPKEPIETSAPKGTTTDETNPSPALESATPSKDGGSAESSEGNNSNPPLGLSPLIWDLMQILAPVGTVIAAIVAIYEVFFKDSKQQNDAPKDSSDSDSN